ncbi:Alpha/beta hydrolase fold-containing protein 21 [Elsinoe fawcettii]|nr:Alpha/beta hydrolase fold-containing protein 21 [Elsinoe fawcettii]
MAPQKLTPASAEAIAHTTVLNETKYRYLLSTPEGQPKGTIFLIHGWPDLAFGWRYQIPYLTALGLRVVVPDMPGYGGTDAPEDLYSYGFKKVSDDLAALAKELGVSKIILGGHDWGGMVVYRFAQWHPDLVTHVFSVCTPYAAPSPVYMSAEDLANGPVPQFGYQVQLASGEVEKAVTTRGDLEQFLSGVYGGKVPEGRVFMTPTKGVDLSLLGKVDRSRLVEEAEMEYVVDQYEKKGLHGPLNWYRTRKVNFEDEQNLPKKKLEQPVLYILANKDNILTKELSAGMERSVPNLIRKEVTAGHWALWQASDEVNSHVKEWLETVVLSAKSNL